jgi:hypothetical protein
MPDIFRRDIVFGRIVFIGPNAARVEAVIKLSGWGRCNRRRFDVSMRDAG